MSSPRLLSAILLVAACLSTIHARGEEPLKELSAENFQSILWTDPGSIRSRNLFYGPGGKDHEPSTPVRFLDEDSGGTSPKFNVRDRDGKKWKVKLGEEAQPETVSTRLLWAMGFNTNENYFLRNLKVEGMPHLHRGQEFVTKAGDVVAVRLQRSVRDKSGTWSWKHNPLKGSREFNGLRVMMALISNWDLKDENNAIYVDQKTPERRFYEVSDLGSSFGMSGKSYTDALAKNNLRAYKRTKFVSKITADYVDFNFPTHPPFLYIFNLPFFVGKLRTRWIGRHIPRSDVRWIGTLLGQLSTAQIHDAFRAAGYSASQADFFADALEERIAQISHL
jgi:hypothetical protein